MPNKGTKGKQGFASMDPERQRAIARRGGQTAHRLGKAHRFTQDEARAAGKKGGVAVSRDQAYMAEIGRRGGENLQRQRAKGKAHNSKEQ
jgi:uncharacterized protein